MVQLRRLKLCEGSGPGAVVEGAEQGDSADAVGQGVADLEQESGPAVGEPIDQLDLPHGPERVELLAGQDATDVENVPQRTGSGRLDPPEVERHLGMGVHPQRPTEAERPVVDPLPEARESFDRADHRALQSSPVGRPIEKGDGHDGGAQYRVPLDLPQGGVGGIQAVTGTEPQHGISGRCVFGPA